MQFPYIGGLVVDISNNNAQSANDINFKKIHAKGHAIGVLMKFTEGTWFIDKFCHNWYPRAKAQGLYVDGYHFCRPDQNPGISGAKEEANYFMRVYEEIVTKFEWDEHDFRPMMDFETAPFSERWARAFDQEVARICERACMFYSYPAAIEEMFLKEPIGDGLDLASWGRNDRKEHPYYVPAPWKRTELHQFTSKGTFPGVPGYVDLNIAHNGIVGMMAKPPTTV